jgi:hypothetical protein
VRAVHRDHHRHDIDHLLSSLIIGAIYFHFTIGDNLWFVAEQRASLRRALGLCMLPMAGWGLVLAVRNPTFVHIHPFPIQSIFITVSHLLLITSFSERSPLIPHFFSSSDQSGLFTRVLFSHLAGLQLQTGIVL